MGWLSSVFRGSGKFPPPAPETSSSSNASSTRPSKVPRHFRILYNLSIVSVASLRKLNKKKMVQENKRDSLRDEDVCSEDGGRVESRDFASCCTQKSSDSLLLSDNTVRPESLSAIKELEALRFAATQVPSSNTSSPETTPHLSSVGQRTDTEERTSTMSARSRVFSILSAPKSSTTSSVSQTHTQKSNILTLPAATMSTDSFRVDLDFTKFENVKIDLPRKHAPAPMFIKNHDVMFLVDDGSGIDCRSWDTIQDLVYGVTKRLCPLTALGDRLADTLLRDIPERDATISVRFINNHHHIARVKNLNQIRNVFNWVVPRQPAQTCRQGPTNLDKPPSHTSPLSVLEFHFWKIYNERLRNNQWLGQMPTTIVLFISSPVSTRPEDMHLFIAECAEKLNAEQVPLPLISILVVQCNSDPVLYRQLVETRRMISWKTYTPRPRHCEPPIPLSGRNAKSKSMIIESKRRPQRDWVDILTVKDWERAGGLPALTGMIEKEIRQGTQRRRELQKEVAKNHLTNRSKHCNIQTLTDVCYEEFNRSRSSASVVGPQLAPSIGVNCAKSGSRCCD